MVIPVNMAAIDAMGKQYNTNIFKNIASSYFKDARRLNKIAARNQPATPGPGRVRGSGATNFRTTRTTPTPVLPAGTPTPRAISAPTRHAPPFTPGATPHSNTGPNRLAIGSGRKPIATPYQPPARVIPMSGNAALTNRVNPNFSFSDAPTTQTTVNRTHFNQPSTTPFTPIAPTAQTASSGTPTAGRNVNFSAATSSAPVTPYMGANHPYPTHEHPAGSSTDILPNLSAAQSTPGRPNQFTVGSRNIRGGGIAAMGSQLEAGLMRRPIGLPEPKRRV